MWVALIACVCSLLPLPRPVTAASNQKSDWVITFGPTPPPYDPNRWRAARPSNNDFKETGSISKIPPGVGLRGTSEVHAKRKQIYKIIRTFKGKRKTEQIIVTGGQGFDLKPAKQLSHFYIHAVVVKNEQEWGSEIKQSESNGVTIFKFDNRLPKGNGDFKDLVVRVEKYSKDDSKEGTLEKGAPGKGLP
jgi:hypothetical protein